MRKAVFFLALLGLTPPLWAEEFIRVPAVIHVHSTVSEKGRLSISEIARLASQYKIKAVILTDTYLARVEYGIPPLRHLFRLIQGKRSVLSFGLKRYLRLIAQAQRSVPEVLLLPGVEVTPFYYWEGMPFDPERSREMPFQPRLINWNKHLLVFGLHDASEYDLTVLSRPYFLPLRGGWAPFFSPVAFLLWGAGILFFRKREFDYRDEGGRPLGPYLKPFRRVGSVFLILGTLFFLDYLLDGQSPHDPYHGDQGPAPYQRVIDDVRKKGGLVFWAHPEAIQSQPIGPIHAQTPPYSKALLETEGYTGFAVYWEGFKQAGQPGGEWDQVLLAYCRGKRASPVWVIGEEEYLSEGELGVLFNNLQTILFAERLDEASLLEAFRKGRMYTLARPREYELILETFQLTDPSGRRALMGEELVSNGTVQVHLKVAASDGSDQPIEVRVVRDGEVWKRLHLKTPCEIAFEDQLPSSGKTYYRADIVRDIGSLIVTNPIFARQGN